jgi:hypothetical protein
MDNQKILVWVGCFITGIVVFRLTDLLLSILGDSNPWSGFSPFLLLVVIFIAQFEIVARIAILSILKHKQPMVTSAEQWPHLDVANLASYTDKLEDLEFRTLLDYNYENEDNLSRLFINRDQSCFADVTQVKNHSMSLVFITVWEQGWVLGVGNTERNPMTEAVSRVFLRQPGDIGKNIQNATADQMFTEFLRMRDQVNSRLNIQPMRFKSKEDYFDLLTERTAKQRKALMRKSMILSQIKIWLATANPKAEYFGREVIRAKIFA